MAKATYFQRGETLDYDNTGETTIEAGTIIALSTRVGVAGCDIAAGETGTVHVEGCYWFDLAATAQAGVDQGVKIYLDSSQKATIVGTGNLLAGFAAAPVAIGDTRLLVKLNAADSDLDTVVAVVNNLTSEVTTSALSAAQGKVLKDAIDALPGDGLVLDPETNAVGVAVDDSTIEIDAENGVQVKDEGITAAKLNGDVVGAGLELNVVTNAIDIVPAVNQVASVASELATLVTDFNTLLVALKAAGFMAVDA